MNDAISCGSRDPIARKQSINIGGRKVTPRLKRLNEQAEQFRGLPKGVSRYDLLRLVNRVGRKIGFTSTLANHLQYLVQHTTEDDWRDGGRPIVYKTVIRQAHDLGVTDRQIANREKALHELGALTWTDSGNHRRMGYRDRDNRLVTACGVNLAPLACLWPQLVELDEEQRAYEDQWFKAKQSLSLLRRQILGRIGTLLDGGPEECPLLAIRDLDAMQCRIRVTVPLDRLNQYVEELTTVRDQLDCVEVSVDNPSGTQKTSARAEENFIPKYSTYNRISLSENSKTVVEDTARQLRPVRPERQKAIQEKTIATGIEHIRIGSVVAAVSPEAKIYLPKNERETGWEDLYCAAEARCTPIGIARHTWIDAVASMGREAAAVAVIIIDRNLNHPTDPVRNAGALLYFMIRKAEAGELHLHRSLFGVLSRHREETQ